jgi:hypothetical protein
MRKYLDTPKIDYVLTHLKFRCAFSDELNQRMIFTKQEDLLIIPENSIVFPLNNQERNLSYQIDYLPIFYPIFPEENNHTFKKTGSVVFSHDIFQQIFCLQTLFYEQELTVRDKLGRIKPEATLNFQLDFLDKPLVDYLFAIIVDELETFCQEQNIEFKRKNLLPKHAFLLSHDVDRVETYSFYNTLNSFKHLALAPNRDNLKRATRHVKEYLRFSARENPLWDFPLMREVEQKYHLNSTYYFLNQGKLHQDAYYSLVSPKISNLITEILADQNEIGLHLTIAGNNEEIILKQNLAKLNSILSEKISGVRSHWLRFEPTITPDILAKLEVKYDSSLGHYSQEGFRTGTCLPYKLFSFSQNKILDVWELPLLYMDCMILDYQNIPEQEAMQKLKNILAEVVKFNGVFTLLWHNGNFANSQPYKRYNFYIKLVEIIMESQPANMTAKQLITNIEEGI